jgi:predicted phosphodiesterase
MRLAILADIHGNLPALEAVLADIDRQEVDRILVAGDTVDGPYPLRTLDLLRARGSWLILGNREKYLLNYDRGDVPATWRVGDQYANQRWIYHHLDREALDFIASLPEQGTFVSDSTGPIRVVHGAPQGLSVLLLPDDPGTLSLFRNSGLLALGYTHVRLAAALAQIGETVLVCGHSHIPWQQEQGGRLALNPGSVGVQIDGSVQARYALLFWQNGRWRAEQRAIPYDLGQVRRDYRESGLLAEGGAFVRAWLLTVETGWNVAGSFVAHFSRLGAEAGFEDYDAIPYAIWEQAEATFDWVTAAAGRRQSEQKVRIEALS